MGVFKHALSERGGQIAAQTFAHELDTTRAVFNYAINLGLILNDPSKDIKRRRIVLKLIKVPSREEFQRLVAAIQQSDGRVSSQPQVKEGLTLLSCSRIPVAAWMRRATCVGRTFPSNTDGLRSLAGSKGQKTMNFEPYP